MIGNDEMADRVRWIRSYVVKETDGRLGTVCIYQARDPEFAPRACPARRHAGRPDFPGLNTIVIREDPAEASAAA